MAIVPRSQPISPGKRTVRPRPISSKLERTTLMLTQFKLYLQVAVAVLGVLSFVGDVEAQSVIAQKGARTPSSVLPAGDIIDKYVEAIGGKVKLKDVKTQVTKGTISIPAAGLKGELEMVQGTQGQFFMTMTIPGVMTQESGSDGTTIWESSNITGTEVLTGARAEQVKLQMTLFPFLEMKQNYETIESTGQEMFGGESCYAIVATKKGLPPVTTYYSVATGLEKGNRMTAVSAMGEMKITSEVKKYEEHDGIKFAQEVEATMPNGMKQLIAIDKIEFNSEITKDKFKLPAEVAKSLKK